MNFKVPHAGKKREKNRAYKFAIRKFLMCFKIEFNEFQRDHTSKPKNDLYILFSIT